MQFLSCTEGGFDFECSLDVRHCRDGVIYNEDGLRVTMLHDRHLGEPAEGEEWNCKGRGFACETRE